jgi:pimeloyl-ACP methyl ester carboxylesterase
MFRRGVSRLAVGVVVALLVPVAAAERATADATALAWTACGPDLQCATLTVPVDEAQPDGAAMGLAVIRRPAGDRAERIGSLVVNPGGPGASGVDFARAAASTYPAALLRRFDLVGFDPRGSGRSDPVHCVDSVDPLFDAAFSPADDAARAALVAAVERVAVGCEANSGALLPYVSTQDTARDLDRLRAALGDHALSFIGESYGSYLGTVYATLFPDRVRAVVLDGAIDPAQDATASTLAQARGFEHALDDFLADCSARTSCPFHHRGRAAAAYDALRARSARAPIPAARTNGRTLNETRFDAAVVETLYGGSSAWPDLATALAAADRGDGARLLAQADAFAGRTANGGHDDSLDGFWAISCLDGPDAPTLADAAHVEALAVAAAPRLGAFIANNSLVCSVWPVPPASPPARLDAAGAPPLLVIGNTRDPATPLASARVLTADLARARLLVVDDEAHTAFASGNACVDAAVTRYLVDRVLPRVGAHC